VGDGESSQRGDFQHGIGAKGATKRWPAQNGPNAKLHLAVGDHPLRIIATEGTKAGYKPALELVSSVDTESAIADKVYDSGEIIISLSSRGRGQSSLQG
jgi:hypothetical protein